MTTSFRRMALTFWPVQLTAWAGFGAVSILGTLPLPDRTRIDSYYTALTVTGFLATLLLRSIYRSLSRRQLAVTALTAWIAVICYVLAVPQSWLAIYFEWIIRFKTLHPHLPANILSSALSSAVTEWVILIAWSALYFGIKQWQQAQLREEKFLLLEAMAQQARLRALRYQITPHFLFNTLNSISTLVGEGDNRGARDMIALLGDFLRTTLVVSDTEDIPLAREVLHMEQYLAIEQVRLGDRLDLRISIESAARDALVPSLLLQPLVENAIQHGIARCPAGGILAMEAAHVENVIRIIIANTTEPYATSLGSSFGMGLKNTADRLTARYGDTSHFEVRTDDAAQWTVIITLPLEAATAP
jgi:sensor histidine kinase YesM